MCEMEGVLGVISSALILPEFEEVEVIAASLDLLGARKGPVGSAEKRQARGMARAF